ncbi:MAG TPA: hypothetical protein QKA08_04095 [Candidatus Megaira endosymbiont of Nemacystus decipiens]|nr:hypothetical protein [Candidatus Megaera endosymbiont of Nemacystus decipiens]
MKRIIIFLSSLFFLNACSVIFGQQPKDLKVIEFDYEGHLEERRMAYEFFWKEDDVDFFYHQDGKKIQWLEIQDVGVAFFDLNDSGEKEMFAYINGQGMCPPLGCPFAILQKQNAEYKPLNWSSPYSKTIITHNSPRIVGKKHNGYYDLVFGDRRKKGHYGLDFHIWKWDGKKYH